MNTSARRAPVPSTCLPARDPEPFPYDSLPAHRPETAGENPASSPFNSPATIAAQQSQWRSLGREEALAEARKTLAEEIAKERSRLTSTLEQFQAARTAYFQKVEREVVGLALAIARKILHREAQVDPLLLAGIVRVALEQVESATTVGLRVNPKNAHDWRMYLSTHLPPSQMPDILEDSAQQLDVCRLETSVGTTDIGLEVQLKEIERGLLDLLAARPGATP